MAVPTHPSDIVVEVVGIRMHSVCGEVVEEDTLLRL
jgi:hypothetical protein